MEYYLDNTTVSLRLELLSKCCYVLYRFFDEKKYSYDENDYNKLVEYLKGRKILISNYRVPFKKLEFELFEFVGFVQATPENVSVGKRSLHRHYKKNGCTVAVWRACNKTPAVLLYQPERQEFILAKSDFLYSVERRSF